eukprot:261331-Pelagomonas_calceolata.AAC.1
MLLRTGLAQGLVLREVASGQGELRASMHFVGAICLVAGLACDHLICSILHLADLLLPPSFRHLIPTAALVPCTTPCYLSPCSTPCDLLKTFILQYPLFDTYPLQNSM